MRHADRHAASLIFGDRLQDDYVLRLRTFIALGHCKLYALTILQRSITFAADGPKMHEYIFTLLSLDEAITFTVVKPLNGTGFALCHLYHPRTAS